MDTRTDEPGLHFPAANAGLTSRGSHRTLPCTEPASLPRPGTETPSGWGHGGADTIQVHKLLVGLKTPKHSKCFVKTAQFSERHFQIISVNGNTMYPTMVMHIPEN